MSILEYQVVGFFCYPNGMDLERRCTGSGGLRCWGTLDGTLL